MKSSFIKVFSAVACVFAFDCVQGMNLDPARRKYKDEINQQIQEIPVTERISWLEKEIGKVGKECDRIWRPEDGYDKDQYDQLNAKRNALGNIIGQYWQARLQAWQAWQA